jgi:hypothetical protein
VRARLDVVVEDEVVVTVALEQRLGAVDGKVFKLQHGGRVALSQRRHELVHELEVWLAAEPALPQAEVRLVVQQRSVVRTHIHHDRKHPLRVEASRRHVQVQLADADSCGRAASRAVHGLHGAVRAQ